MYIVGGYHDNQQISVIDGCKLGCTKSDRNMFFGGICVIYKENRKYFWPLWSRHFTFKYRDFVHPNVSCVGWTSTSHVEWMTRCAQPTTADEMPCFVSVLTSTVGSLMEMILKKLPVLTIGTTKGR